MGKSPFAEKKTVTYKYPEPWDNKEEDEKVAQDENYVTKIDPEELEEAHWVKIRIPKSRADADAVADFTQSTMIMGGNGDGAPRFEQRIAMANRAVFDLLSEDWSFDAECNGANYARLDDWSGDWITACLADAVRQGTDRGWAKKMKNSSDKPETLPAEQSPPVPAE